MTHAGIVAVVGVPNVGKSTLLNRVIGQKLSITSPKPQSTRTSVIGIRTEGDTQIAFVDTPGLLEPAYELQRAMRAAAIHALKDADVVVYLVDATEGEPVELPAKTKSSPLIVFNKIDLLGRGKLDELKEKFP